MNTSMQNGFKIYNLNLDIELNDAVKITSEHSETFWVEIETIENNIIIGKVLNKLIFNHNYDLNDIITFNKNNIKLVNKYKNRKIISNVNKTKIIKFYQVFNTIHNRNPTEIEFENFINTRIIKN